MIAKGDNIGPVRFKSGVVAKGPISVEAVTAVPEAEADSDNGTVATSPWEGVKNGGCEHLVSSRAIWPIIETQMIDKTLLPSVTRREQQTGG
jgi:hypothetical protein